MRALRCVWGGGYSTAHPTAPPSPPHLLAHAETDAANLKACDFGLSDYFKPGQQFTQLIGSAYYVVSGVSEGGRGLR